MSRQKGRSPEDIMTDIAPLTQNTSTSGHSIPLSSPPPETPLPWIWKCHLCNHRYPLGVTRRCLYDGHYYCNGQSNESNRKGKRKLKNKKAEERRGMACSSEFDYEGWQNWGDWRQRRRRRRSDISTISMRQSPSSGSEMGVDEDGDTEDRGSRRRRGRCTAPVWREPEGCENCDFPSECHTPEAQTPVPRKRRKKKNKRKQKGAAAVRMDGKENEVPNSNSNADMMDVDSAELVTTDQEQVLKSRENHRGENKRRRGRDEHLWER